jgi:GTP-binding protein
MTTIEHKIIRGSAEFRYAFSDPDQLKEWLNSVENFPGITFVGRSNVGKSSLINALFGNKTARTSKTPGRTREINIFTFSTSDGTKNGTTKNLYLIDLPGYGHANISKEMAQNWQKLIDTFFSNLPKTIGIINVQDARRPDQDIDKEFNNYIGSFDVTTFLVLNKIDKLKKQTEKSALEKQRVQIIHDYNWIKCLITTSAENGAGVSNLEREIISFLLPHHTSNNQPSR